MDDELIEKVSLHYSEMINCDNRLILIWLKNILWILKITGDWEKKLKIFLDFKMISKFLAIDYGLIRTGLSISDSDKIFAFPLETIETNKLINHLSILIENENISRIIIGQPKRFSGQNSEIESSIIKFIDSISNIFDKNQIFRYDERFTSKIAKKAIISSGVKKKARSDKSLVDKISATIILQDYLQAYNSNS